nr:MAG TPA: hypothetical protein [Caudoviricetes sp.]
MGSWSQRCDCATGVSEPPLTCWFVEGVTPGVDRVPGCA